MSTPHTQPSAPRLLIVDDLVASARLLFHIFSADHAVCIAASGEEALALCAEQLPDLILLDVKMPGMDGHEVFRRLKSDPLTCDIPVIFVTARNDPSEETLGLQLGAVDFISKPVNAAIVRARVRTHLLLRNTLAQVKTLNEQLEKRVDERTAELESTLQRLHESQENLVRSEAKATLSTLVASVSHELGTPIGNSVIAASTLSDQAIEFQVMVETGALRRSKFMAFLASLGQSTDLIQQNLRRANELLRNFRQVAADQASEQRREFDLAAVVREIIHTLTPTLKGQPHRIDMLIPPGILMDSQPGPLGQIVINLINNAYLHAFENRRDGVLTFSADVQGKLIHIRIADNGVGIPTDHLDQLFLPFFSTKIGQGGTGLGMAIVQNLVTKTLGGRITVASTVGQGTCFDIFLPRELPTTTTVA